MISLACVLRLVLSDFLLTAGQRVTPPINPADEANDVEDNTEDGDDGGEVGELLATVGISERPNDAQE